MTELLFEIFCEEIPARMQARAGVDLEKALVDGLKKAGLNVDAAKHWAGPRRLGFTADVPLKSPDISEERKGPRVGAPEQALAGFMRGAGISDISQAEIRDDKKGQFYVAKIEKPGRATADILSELIPDVMNNFPWPKSMKSGGSSFRWVRPLQRILCVLDGTVVPVEAGGVTASNITEGHRQHGRGPFEVNSYASYKKTLETDGHVLLDIETRKEKILSDAKAVCASKGLELVEDAGLLNEVAGLNEWPVVLLGDMDPAFLELPGEVIRLTLKSHQKTFTVRDPKTGDLAAHYIIVANQIAPDGGEAIKTGNDKVISARLSDAQFFQSEDAKQKLMEYYDKLDTVVFHKKLGSIRDKVERVAALARELAPKVGADPDQAELAAKLSKCDLVTQTVIEFTSLEGQIGALMYAREGGDAAICDAIEHHYKPKGPSDAVPTNPVAVVVALADKLDTLVGFWAINEKPTGSKDPFALRRAALGVVRIVLENDVRLGLEDKPWSHFLVVVKEGAVRMQKEAVAKVMHLNDQGIPLKNTLSASFDLMKTMPDTNWSMEQLIEPLSGTYRNLLAFILDRLKVYLRDKGIRHDIIDAALSTGGDDLVAIVNRTAALQDFLSTDDGENLLAGYKRAANILKAEAKKGDLPDGKPSKGTLPEEGELYVALEAAQAEIETALSQEAYSTAMTALSTLRAPIDAFFDNVMVNSQVAEERENRLRLLQSIRLTAGQIADFDKVEG